MLLTRPVLAQSLSPRRPVRLPDVALPPRWTACCATTKQAWRAGDTDRTAAHSRKMGSSLQSNRPPVEGRAAIKAAYEESPGGGPLQLRALAFAAEETSGYIIGAYGYGKGPGDLEKFTLTLRRVPGSPWLIVSRWTRERTAEAAVGASRSDARRDAGVAPGPERFERRSNHGWRSAVSAALTFATVTVWVSSPLERDGDSELLEGPPQLLRRLLWSRTVADRVRKVSHKGVKGAAFPHVLGGVRHRPRQPSLGRAQIARVVHQAREIAR